MKHAPGPWSAGKYSAPPDAAGTIGYWVDSPSGDIADVCERSDGSANAALIAAAPDLLAACEALLKRVRLAPHDISDSAPRADCIKRAAAAIARVKGEAQ